SKRLVQWVQRVVALPTREKQCRTPFQPIYRNPVRDRFLCRRHGLTDRAAHLFEDDSRLLGLRRDVLVYGFAVCLRHQTKRITAYQLGNERSSPLLRALHIKSIRWTFPAFPRRGGCATNKTIPVPFGADGAVSN